MSGHDPTLDGDFIIPQGHDRSEESRLKAQLADRDARLERLRKKLKEMKIIRYEKRFEGIAPFEDHLTDAEIAAIEQGDAQ